VTGDGLTSLDFQDIVFVLNLDHPFQANPGFRKLVLWFIFGPSGWANDSSRTHRVILCGDPARQIPQ
jgi:hypothetical protein